VRALPPDQDQSIVPAQHHNNKSELEARGSATSRLPKVRKWFVEVGNQFVGYIRFEKTDRF
jgi:hypothetical protein